MINTFRDKLMLDSFDRFRSLIGELNDLKADFRKQRRRVKPSLGIIISYQAILKIALPLNKIFNGKRYSEQTSINMFCLALKKLELLIRELVKFDCHSLADTLQHLYNRLFVLLPSGSIIQPPLFDTDSYESDSKKPTATQGFLNWLLDYSLQGYLRRDIERRKNRKSLDLRQFSLQLCCFKH